MMKSVYLVALVMCFTVFAESEIKSANTNYFDVLKKMYEQGSGFDPLEKLNHFMWGRCFYLENPNIPIGFVAVVQPETPPDVGPIDNMERDVLIGSAITDRKSSLFDNPKPESVREIVNLMHEKNLVKPVTVYSDRVVQITGESMDYQIRKYDNYYLFQVNTNAKAIGYCYLFNSVVIK